MSSRTRKTFIITMWMRTGIRCASSAAQAHIIAERQNDIGQQSGRRLQAVVI
jgi:hypothetical protein